jgi:hypothetical protein
MWATPRPPGLSQIRSPWVRSRSVQIWVLSIKESTLAGSLAGGTGGHGCTAHRRVLAALAVHALRRRRRRPAAARSTAAAVAAAAARPTPTPAAPTPASAGPGRPRLRLRSPPRSLAWIINSGNIPIKNPDAVWIYAVPYSGRVMYACARNSAYVCFRHTREISTLQRPQFSTVCL